MTVWKKPNKLSYEPAPLILQNRKLVIAWSPKSACSHVVVWYFLHDGLLRAANYYNPWPHHFRMQVYYNCEGYRQNAQAVLATDGEGFTLLKVTRNPVKRLVSIFRHVVRHDFMYDEIKAKLGLDVAKEGLSLCDLDAFLDGRRLVTPTNINSHLCAQVHPSWFMNFDRTITLNIDQTGMNPGLNAVEAEFNLKKTDFDAVGKFRSLSDSHYAKEGAIEIDGPIEEHRFKPSETATFPKRQLEKSPLTEQMARKYHAIDFQHVGSGDSAGKLFQNV